MRSRALVNPENREFYCWRWNRWYRYKKLRNCIGNGCLGMVAPRRLEWRARSYGGLLVPMGGA